MESHGLAGEIQVTEEVFDRLDQRYMLEPCGTIEVKGNGPMSTYLLKGVHASIGESSGETSEVLENYGVRDS
jgi:hypothetical protein